LLFFLIISFYVWPYKSYYGVHPKAAIAVVPNIVSGPREFNQLITDEMFNDIFFLAFLLFLYAPSVFSE